jgi:hypothetical protein
MTSESSAVVVLPSTSILGEHALVVLFLAQTKQLLQFTSARLIRPTTHLHRKSRIVVAHAGSRHRSRAAARLGAKLLAARVQKLSVQARSKAGRMQLGQRLRVAHCELYCIRTLLRGRR